MYASLKIGQKNPAARLLQSFAHPLGGGATWGAPGGRLGDPPGVKKIFLGVVLENQADLAHGY